MQLTGIDWVIIGVYFVFVLGIGAEVGIKGGWLAIVHTYPSEMAQNFWTAIFAWTVCFLATIVISLATRPRPEAELTGLVYSLTFRHRA